VSDNSHIKHSSVIKQTEHTIWDYPHNTPLSIDEINEVTAEIRFS